VKARILLAGVFLLCAPAGASAAEPLPPHVVQVVGATSDAYEAATVGGELWVATSGGLVVLGGRDEVATLGPMQGMPGARLRSVSVVPEGVWLGGIDGAALVTSGPRGELRVARTVPLKRVRRVVAMGTARYFGVFGGGLLREDPGGILSPVRGVGAQAQVTDLVVQGDGLYMATAGAGVMRIDAKGRVDRRWRARDGLADDVVWDLEPSGHRLLVATAAGISVIDGGAVIANAPEAEAGRAMPVHDVRALAAVGGSVVAATFGAGLQRLEGSSAHPAGGPRFARSVTSTGEGAALVPWADGLASVDAGGRTSPRISGGLPSADISALAAGTEGLWVGTFDRGLVRLDGSGEVHALAEGAVDARVNDVAVVPAGAAHAAEAAGAADLTETVYVATDAGLFAGHGSTFARVEGDGAPPREHLSALYFDPRTGDLWAAGAHGLSRRSRGAWTQWASRPGQLPEHLDAACSDPSGALWVGSVQGLLRFDPSASRVERHGIASGDLSSDWVTACTSWEGGIVAGTYNGGLSFFGPSGTMRVTEGDGLPSGWVNPHAIRAAMGELLLGTLDRGLIMGRPGAWRRIGLEGALPSADVTSIAPGPAGTVWIGTRGGLARMSWKA
jgi:ligand-binding sensor domain-containing protein